jgi:protocatechuate 3,4-dioxygenase beta subunit
MTPLHAQLVVAISMAGAIQALSPPPTSVEAPATGAIAIQVIGQVLADDTGDPVANVRVSVTPSATAGRTVVLTDNERRFTLDGPTGVLRVAARKTGYAPETVVVPAGRSMQLRLRRGAVVSGRVVDDSGVPVIAARVTVEARGDGTQPPRLLAAAETDDRGEYRVGGLPPGPVIVGASTIGTTLAVTRLANGNVMSSPALHKIYFPGVDGAADAFELSVRAGEEQPDIDFVVPAGRAGNQPFSVLSALPSWPPMRRSSSRDDQAPATGIVRGRVRTSDGTGLARVLVLLSPQSRPSDGGVVRSDNDGRFEFREVAAGSYRVLASSHGYVPAAMTGNTLGGALLLTSAPTITIAPGGTREDVDVTLVPWATVTGRVVDEAGDAVQGAAVQLLQVRYEDGRRRIVPVGARPRLTDDRGGYRLFGMAPGAYLVSASVGDIAAGDLPGYARTYFPGTTNAPDAQFIRIPASGELTGIDLQLARTTTYRVTGHLRNAAGEPGMGGTLQLITSQRSTPPLSISVGARITPDGAFEFANVPAGSYVIQAYRGNRNGFTEGEFGALPVTVVDGDVLDLTLQTSVGSSVSGTISFDNPDRTTWPSLTAAELRARPVDLDASPATNVATADVQADGRFTLAGLNGPRRLHLARAPIGWMLKEIRVGGIDVTDQAIALGRADQSLSDVEVVLTDRVSALYGTIADSGRRPAPGTHVIAFSTDAARWFAASRYLHVTEASRDGTFVLSGLPFGSYHVAAVAARPADGEDAWQDPRFLESIRANAVTVSIADGEKRSVDVVIAR